MGRWLCVLVVLLLTHVHARANMQPGSDAVDQITLQIDSRNFVVLCFHDVRDDVRPLVDADPHAVSTRNLASFFDWMRTHRWHPVSLQQFLDARAGKTPLPPNSVLLTFDDGLKSIYTKVFPLLKAYGYPAVFSLETGWLTHVQGEGDGKPIAPVSASSSAFDDPAYQQGTEEGNRVRTLHYEGRDLGTEGFASWAELREMAMSGLVAFATHTHALHQGIAANPQGNLEPAALTRAFRPEQGRYETEAEYRARIVADLRRSAEIIKRNTGIRPQSVVWPYGAVSRELAELAASVGLPLSFGLGESYYNDFDSKFGVVNRLLVVNDPTPVQLEHLIERSLVPQQTIQRAVQVDMDYIYDADPAQIERNLGKLLDRIREMQIKTVYLQAFADPDGDGTAEALYFPNRELPMRADLFNRVAWQLITRAEVRVYAWLPLLAFDLPDEGARERLGVKVRVEGRLLSSHQENRRLSPFLPENVEIIGNIYEDLAINTPALAGVLVHDDAYLTEEEDAASCGPEARWPGTDLIFRDCNLSVRQKTLALIEFGNTVITRLKRHNNLSSGFRVARNLYARVVLDPQAEARFSQALEPFLHNYDEVVLMAMPYLDGTTEPADRWLRQLLTRVRAVPGAGKKVVFQLQAKDWRDDSWIPAPVLREWMRGLIRGGAVNLAYYPDDFLNNRPQLLPVREGISLNDFFFGEARR